MRRTVRAAVLVVTAFAVPAVPAAADDSFAGTCDPIEGTATFDTPLAFSESDNGYHFKGTGTCSGTLNGAQVSDAPISAQVDGKFTGSCVSSESTSPGPGKIVFTKGTPASGDDVTVTFTMTFVGEGSEVDFVLKGTKSGEATGHASFLTTRTPPDVLLKCASGGNSELPFDASSTTSSALTSSASASSSGGGGGEQPGQPAGGGASGGGTTPSSQGGSTSVSLEIPAQRLRAVLKSGLRVTCRASGPADCAIMVSVPRKAAKRYKLKGTIASGSASIASGASAADVVLKLSAKARRQLRKAKSIKLTLVATVGDRKVQKTITLKR